MRPGRVKGTKVLPIKRPRSGPARTISGGSPKKASKAGVATFHLGHAFGRLNVLFDAGELGSLYYLAGKSFKA